MTKVALINPGKDAKWSICEPLNLGYIASYLERNNVEVTIIDELAEQNVEKEIDKFKPDVVGLTATTPLAPDAYRIADLCRERGIRTVMGGVHVSALPEDALSHVDIVVQGEGELAMMDILNGKTTSGIVSAPCVKDLDTIPPPARHLMQVDFYMCAKDRLGDVVSHLHFVPSRTKVANVLSSRGCPYRCIFCHNSCRSSPVRFHSAERVVSELKQLFNVYGAEAVFFMDDNFFANRPRARKMCALIKENNLDILWGCNATSNHCDEETLRMAKDAGCRELVFGFESGSQRILNILNKRTTVEGNARAIRMCKKIGLMVVASFMVGNPTETVEDIRATQRFIIDNLDGLDMYGVNITTPYPGTKLWEWCKEQGLIPKSFKWTDFNQSEMKVLACTTIEPHELESLYLETFSIQQVKLSRLLSKWWSWHRLQAIGWALRHPCISAKLLFKAIWKRGS